MNLDELLENYESKHSAFQIKNFIVGGQCSDWAKYKQCAREIKSRSVALDNLYDELFLHEIKKGGFFEKIKLFFMTEKKRSIRLKQTINKDAAIEESIKHTKRELDLFVSIATKLKASIGELNKEKRAMLEADSWMQKARQLAAVEIMAQGRPSKSTIEFILSLPKDSQRSVLLEIKSVKPEKILMIDDHEPGV